MYILYICFVLVSVYVGHHVVPLQVLKILLYRGGAAEFFTDSTIFFLHRCLSDSTFATISLTRSRSQVYIVFVNYS
jgi:hypothetical protein